MEKRKRRIIDISESDATSIEDISSSTSSDNNDDYEDEEEEESSSSGSQHEDDDNDDDDDDDDDEEEEEEEEDEEVGMESGCDRVLRLLQGGGVSRKIKEELSKLSLMDCKTYLRSNELRLSGTKEECIQRIAEHWRMKDGNGQRLYPRSSFIINCTGDVCKGDVVLFTQKVYKNFDKMTRGGELLGKRTIAGRIVKESYGAAKQQHTFTVEVLWTQGVKKLPPLFPLLVKGRNLYKMKTFRQKWKNEGKRLEVLAEKHKRGEAARSIRATRKSKSMTKPTKASSKNKGNKRQNLDHHERPSEMMQTSKVKKRDVSTDERGKTQVGSKRAKHHHQKPRPLGRLNSESRNSRALMRHPNSVPVIRETSLQFNYPSTYNFRHFESDFYSQRVPYSHSSNWGPTTTPQLSLYSSYALPARERQQYDHGSYPNFSYPRYVSQSSDLPHFSDMVGTHRSSGSFPYVNDEHRWNF